MATKARRWAGPEYHVKAEFRAPISYVYSWCTDFAPGDDRREKDHYTRRIIQRTSRQVVFEDLVDSDQGWVWARHVVTLHPPNRWHSDSVGTHRDATIDYVLTPLGDDRTRLDLIWKRAPTALSTSHLSKAAMEKSSTEAWRNFARVLEKDYRSSRSRRAR
jgi:hypothetical protein